MANSRTERLCVLLPVSLRSSCSVRMYLFQPPLLSADLPNKINAIPNSSRTKSNNEKIAATASNRRNMVCIVSKASFQVCIVGGVRIGLRLETNEDQRKINGTTKPLMAILDVTHLSPTLAL